MNAGERETAVNSNLKNRNERKEKKRIVAMPMCSRERLSLDFPSIDRSRFSLLLLFSSRCGSARNVHSIFSMISFFFRNDSEPAERGFFSFLTTTVVVVGSYDEFGNPDILVKKRKWGGGWV